MLKKVEFATSVAVKNPSSSFCLDYNMEIAIWWALTKRIVFYQKQTQPILRRVSIRQPPDRRLTNGR
jgi:hypothetical protein